MVGASGTTIHSQAWEREKLEASAESARLKKYQEYISSRDLWIHNLEMCESSGNNDAVNWYDKDGTASYYAFQFKPSTFRYYGEKYKVINKGKNQAQIMQLLHDYSLQKKIVQHMVEDKSVRWNREFPDCVKKHGLPPKFFTN